MSPPDVELAAAAEEPRMDALTRLDVQLVGSSGPPTSISLAISTSDGAASTNHARLVKEAAQELGVAEFDGSRVRVYFDNGAELNADHMAMLRPDDVIFFAFDGGAWLERAVRPSSGARTISEDARVFGNELLLGPHTLKHRICIALFLLACFYGGNEVGYATGVGGATADGGLAGVVMAEQAGAGDVETAERAGPPPPPPTAATRAPARSSSPPRPPRPRSSSSPPPPPMASSWCASPRLSAEMSSVYGDGEFPASNAIDGNRETSADKTSLIGTTFAANNWLTVAVPEGTAVAAVTVYNRDDDPTYIPMLPPFELWVGNASAGPGSYKKGVRCAAADASSDAKKQTIACEGAIAPIGQYVTLRQVGEARYLALAELEVYAVCSPPPAPPAPPSPPSPPPPPPSPPSPPYVPRGYTERSCASGEVCVGHASCEWPSAESPAANGRSEEPGSLWGHGASVAKHAAGLPDCVECGCRPITWPVLECAVTIMPDRERLFGDVQTGWASQVNVMMLYAVPAINSGRGFQMSHGVCAEEDRGSPHCFFRPLSNCGEEVQVPYDLPSPPQWPSVWEASQACHKAAAALGIDAPCDGRLASWRVIAKLVLRVQPDIEATIQRTFMDGLPWAAGRFGGLHIRRGDKIGREAKAVPPCAYADRLAQLSGEARGLDVFIATDDHRVIGTVRKCEATTRLGWRLRDFGSNPGRGQGRGIVYRLYAELSLLVRAEWAVVTYSSNVGKLVQVLREQPEATLASMDDHIYSANSDLVPDPSRRHEWHEG